MEIIQLSTKSCYLDIYNYPFKVTIILSWALPICYYQDKKRKY